MNVSPLNAPKRKTGEMPPLEPSGIEPNTPNSPSPVDPPPTRASELAAYGTLLGIGMIALAVIWRIGFGDDTLATWFPRDRWAFQLAVGAAVGPLFSVAAWLVFRRVPSFQQIKTIILRTIDMQTLAPHHAVLFGLVAGIPEEILFRGAVQPAIGWLLTALLFGILHSVTPAYFLYATLASALLSMLASWTGGLWAPIAAHTMIDISMFLLLMRTWRRRQRRAKRQLERERECVQNSVAGWPPAP
ncbi:MAG: CPBP family intramembrane metalloprotease [Chloroflexi bacterium]|nr:CPBP family intramembrane metalloprotease [Chloroflexota bacterium]